MIITATLEQEDKDRIYNKMANSLSSISKPRCTARINKIDKRLERVEMEPEKRAILTERRRLLQQKRSTL